MTRVISNSLLVIPPFECAWLSGEELQFKSPGSGCLSFEARAENDITVVFTEDIGARHYRTEQSRNYIVVLGSHKNRRVKIEVDCQPVADVESSIDVNGDFAKYWIDINQGVISVGRGDPGKNLLLRWVDSDPQNHRVRHVGLSSWDRYVGYRNISLLPSVDFAAVSSSVADEGATALFREVSHSLSRFLNCAHLADLLFLVRRSTDPTCCYSRSEALEDEEDDDVIVVHAHSVLLASCCFKLADLWLADDRRCRSSAPDELNRVVHLPHVDASVLISLLEYAYTGKTQIPFRNMAALRDLAADVGLYPLVASCEAIILQTLQQSECPSPTETVEVAYETLCSEGEDNCSASPFSLLPLDMSRLESFYETGEFSDVTVIVGGTRVARVHRLVLSAWSDPFCKMFTIGMRESHGTEIYLEDTSPKAMQALLGFMYTSKLDFEQDEVEDDFLVSLLFLADQFGLDSLKIVCSTYLMDHISEAIPCTSGRKRESRQRQCRLIEGGEGLAASANFARVAIPSDIGNEVGPSESLSKPCDSAVDSEMAGES
ncbi:hypothetical protein CBR_g18852 [Chara braunii]|uniref:BTB domain-containing protein n=1 Tax=Chara braunii TaxID=69332 RepID=A0A388KWJ5_CHABU|nr:hypothetical protein CBR_g18852 [Chara braunii]|eukprot:GBG74440.1 hypothetical protein CBR_g18852 [Chara braunii]